jgi:hypothetical protein
MCAAGANAPTAAVLRVSVPAGRRPHLCASVKSVDTVAPRRPSRFSGDDRDTDHARAAVHAEGVFNPWRRRGEASG